MELEHIREKARNYFDEVDPSHDWHQVERVEKLAETLSERENADEEIVKLAIFLHDIGRGKEDRDEIDDHAEWGAQEAEDIMEEHGYGKETIERVKQCIRAHRFSNDIEPTTVEAEVLADADNLDALGASGVARTFYYSGENGRVISDAELFPEGDESEYGKTGLNHLTNKILALKQRMYTEAGRKIAEERQDFIENFVEQMEGEIEGER